MLTFGLACLINLSGMVKRISWNYLCTVTQTVPYQPTTQNDNKFAKPFSLKCSHCVVDSLVLPLLMLLLFYPFCIHRCRRSYTCSSVRLFKTGAQFLVAVQTNLSKCIFTVYVYFITGFYTIFWHSNIKLLG